MRVVIITILNKLPSEKSTKSYAILAPQSEGKFVDAKQSTAAVLTTIQLDENDYRIGHTKARQCSNPTFHSNLSSFSRIRPKFPVLCKKYYFTPNYPMFHKLP